MDEATIADATGRGATLRDHQRVALALADAEMSQPGTLPSAVVDQLRRCFGRAELVELTLDVMKWNYQKVAVALGVDDEVRPGALSELSFDADGNPVV